MIDFTKSALYVGGHPSAATRSMAADLGIALHDAACNACSAAVLYDPVNKQTVAEAVKVIGRELVMVCAACACVLMEGSGNEKPN